MYKKLLVFSLAFCLGFIFAQFAGQKSETPEPSITSNKDQPIQLSKRNPRTDFFRVFQKAVAEEDKEKVASLVSFPLEIHYIKKGNTFRYYKIRNREDFLALYYELFNDNFKQFVAQTKAERLFASTSGEIFTLGSELRMKSFPIDEIGNSEIKVIQLTKYLN